MSLYQFFASHKPLKEKTNPYIERWSINELTAKGMEVPFNMLDKPIDREEKIFFWCDSEDHMYEITIYHQEGSPFRNFKEASDKSQIAILQWRYTDKRAEELIQYIKEVLNEENSDCNINGVDNDITTYEIELWHIWMDDTLDELDVREFEVNQLTVPMIRELFGKECYENPVCLRIRK